MKIIGLFHTQTARLFPTKAAALTYIKEFVPDVAEPEVCQVIKRGSGSAWGILMLQKTGDTDKRLFGLGPDQTGGAK